MSAKLSSMRQWLRAQQAEDFYFALDWVLAHNFIVNNRCLICGAIASKPNHLCWWRVQGDSSLLRRDPRYWQRDRDSTV